MFTSKKIQTVGTVKEFLTGQEKKVKQDWVPLAAAGSALPLILNTMPTFSFAATNTSVDVSQKVISAFDPLTELVKGLSYPLAFLAFSAAGIYWLIGNRPKAVEMMQGATIGYVIVQLSPMLMRLLVSVTAGF
ncbi:MULTISPECIES: hypothetical protein [Priestia]|jgi:hypothetical protein|uniref:hypothetical protein n=1 Tax=Priestia TaxID=2800373 RepID=UPI002D7FC119|nr:MULTISPECIES: hypothetical protein [Priestia]MEB4856069.1 hypothetical protein [Priestia megaterium]MED3888231.1 hypothetical protein [Priestia aryabhattai]MED4261351.1 hypothetical protein [Priestia aryabhattai]